MFSRPGLAERFARAFEARGWIERFAKKDPNGNLHDEENGRFVAKERGANAAGGSPHQSIPQVQYRDAQPGEFLQARNRTDRPEFLSPKEEEELADTIQQGGIARLSADGTSGYVLTADGDLKSVFNNGGPKGAGTAAVIDAISRGAKTLDCIGDALAVLYSKVGFVAYRAQRWSDEHAPNGWPYERRGRPDIYFMRYEGKSRDPEQIRADYGTYPDLQHPGYGEPGGEGVGGRETEHPG